MGRSSHMLDAIALLALQMVAQSCVVADEPAAKFRSEAGAGWRQIRADIVNCRGDATQVHESFIPDAKDQEFTVEHSFNARDGNFLYRSKGIAGSTAGIEYVDAYNSAYAFRLKENYGDFAITDISESKASVVADIEKQRVAFMPIMVVTEPVDWLAAQPGFAARDVTLDSEGGRPVSRISFSYGKGPREDFKLLDGTIWFLPENLWAIKRFEVRIQYADGIGVARGVTEYDLSHGPLPLPVKHTCDFYDENAKEPYIRQSFAFSDVGPGTVREEDCMLSAFGLPESAANAVVRRPRLILYLLLSGVLLFALAVALRYGARRWANRRDTAEAAQ